MVNTNTLYTSKGNVDLSTPAVMGILNITPDSFYEGSRYQVPEQILKQTEQMLKDGADIIDIGASSTRPGSAEVSSETELKRLLPVLEKLVRQFPEAIISIDTYRSEVARESIAMGAAIINDISGGRFDPEMFRLISETKTSYIMMHIKGTPGDMQKNPEYEDVVSEVLSFFKSQLNKLNGQGVINNIVLDPGFGFGKNQMHNFSLLKNLAEFKKFNCPLMVGVSRKSMINRVLGTTPEESLNGTTAINTIALLNGADIMRVHDVKQAVEAVKLTKYYNSI